MTDFKAALDWVDDELSEVSQQIYIMEGRTSTDHLEKKAERLGEMRLALRIADRIVQEPSEGMLVKAGASPTGVSPRGGTDYTRKMLPKYFRAMVDQMMKEIKDGLE